MPGMPVLKKGESLAAPPGSEKKANHGMALADVRNVLPLILTSLNSLVGFELPPSPGVKVGKNWVFQTQNPKFFGASLTALCSIEIHRRRSQNLCDTLLRKLSSYMYEHQKLIDRLLGVDRETAPIFLAIEELQMHMRQNESAPLCGTHSGLSCALALLSCKHRQSQHRWTDLN